MHRRYALTLLLLGLITTIIAAYGVASPGYMDADYYYSMGIQWSRGDGGDEPFLWNYLGQPESIPTPSHAYWSPLTSMIIGVVLRVFGDGFRVAQVPFLILTAILPFLVWRLALAMGEEVNLSFQAGLLALAPGFFLPFFLSTDVFSFYAFLGVVMMLALKSKRRSHTGILWLGIGILSGAAHLCRADGFLLLVFPLLHILTCSTDRLRRIGFLAIGYGLVMAPWVARNMIQFGSPFHPSGGQTLWLLSYDEIFSYGGTLLTPQRWWGAGIKRVLLQRLSAMWVIAQRILAENGLVFLAPFMLVGMKARWQDKLVRSTGLYLLMLLFVMSFIFPFAGARGGWFHSSVAVMPLLWIMAPIGLKEVLKWVGERRDWDLLRASKMYGSMMIMLALLLTWGLYVYRVIGIGQEEMQWNLPNMRYEALDLAIRQLDPAPGVVAINNPPGFYHVSGLQTVVLPHGDIEALRKVVEQYDVSWVVVDLNHPQQLRNLYLRDEIPAWLHLEIDLNLYGDTFIVYRVIGTDS
jgi:hypothetical protein